LKIALFVEGPTERAAIPEFLKRWLDPRISKPVGIYAVKFKGWSEYVKDIVLKVELNLRRKDVLGGIGLLDLSGPTFYRPRATTVAQKYDTAKADIESRVKHDRFRQHFAVHETEAWLFSDISVLPTAVQRTAKKAKAPEAINFDEPPSKLLNRLYQQHLHHQYRKTTDGASAFQNLSPDEVYAKCPHFRRLADDLLALAKG
jgi:Domain of unknown function (DUF4276)